MGLGRLMHRSSSAALVLLVDQMDEMIELAKNDAQPGELFRSAINALVGYCRRACRTPWWLSVVWKNSTAKPGSPRHCRKLDRLENDPKPIRLESDRRSGNSRHHGPASGGVLRHSGNRT